MEQQKIYCKKCGTEVSPESAFCSECGEPVDTTLKCEKCGAELKQGATFCSACGERTDGERVCAKCGKPIGENEKFCRVCGTPADGTPEQKAQTKVPTDNKRIAGGIFTCVGAAVMVLWTFIFMATPFLSVKYLVDTAKTTASLGGLEAIGCMFGGRNLLEDVGVADPTVRFAGWAHFVYLFVFNVAMIIALVVGFMRDKARKPKWFLTTASVGLAVAFLILIIDIVARCQVDVKKEMIFSSYLGGIGVFVTAAIGFALIFVGQIFYKQAYAEVGQDKKRPLAEKLQMIASACLAGIAVIMLLAPAFAKTIKSDQEIKLGQKGRAYVDVSNEVTYPSLGAIGYVGATVFDLPKLERGEKYSFTIKYGDAPVEILSKSVSLVNTGSVEKITNVQSVVSCALTESFSTDITITAGKIVMEFSANYMNMPEKMSVVVYFCSDQPVQTVKFRYKFEGIEKS